MTTPLSITVEQDGAARSLVARGEIDLSNVTRLTDALDTAVAANPGGMFSVDFRAVEYIDSTGINVLFNYAERIARLLVRPLLLPVFRITGLTELTEVQSVPAGTNGEPG